MRSTISKIVLAATLGALGTSAVAKAVTRTKTDLVPLPVHVVRTLGEFRITPRTTIFISDNAYNENIAADYLNHYLGSWLGTPLSVRQREHLFPGVLQTDHITLLIDSLLQTEEDRRMPTEGYRLRVSQNGIEITGVDDAGLMNGVQTLLQLLPTEIYQCKKNTNALKISSIEITDWPAYPYRGMMLDVARTFVPAPEVKVFIDRLAHHKINKLHWHLVDDEGWRIEIKSYPELAKKGGFRGNDLPVKPIYGAWDREYGGYYTQDQIRGIVSYAARRNIEIIPEIDLPGHSRAVACVYPEILCPGPAHNAAGYDRRNVWCATKEDNYLMLAKILEEVCALFPSEFINIGGDEVLRQQWLSCPTCGKLASGNNIQPVQDHFTTRLTAILADLGRKPAVWDEAAASGKLSKSARVHGWQHLESCKDAAEKGYGTVIMPGSYFYFDMKQSPWEDGLTWAGLVDTRRTYSLDLSEHGFSPRMLQNVEGFEGAFFSELLLSHTPEYLYYQCYPRVCALAEVAWSQQRLRDADDFHNRLYGRHADRLSAMGIGFRVPPPDAYYADGKIDVAYRQRHSGVRFTTDGTPPKRGSGQFSCPLNSYDIERFRFRSYLNDSQSASVPVIIRYPGTVPAGGTFTTELPLPEQSGLWYLRVRSTELGAVIRSIRIEGAGTPYYIIRNSQRVNEQHQMRFYADERTVGGKMVVEMRNDGKLPTVLDFQFERSPYIEPKVVVSSNVPENQKFPLSGLADYNFSSYARTSRTCRAGDHVTFTFQHGVQCRSIEVHTGLSYLPRYHIPAGRVEISTDGVQFTSAAQLDGGKALIEPDKNVTIKALRIVSTMNGNGEDAIAIQDLKIIPRYK
jgi:hexosaminidase